MAGNGRLHRAVTRAWPFVLPLVAVTALYPGILYPDSFIRWNAARQFQPLAHHPLLPEYLMGAVWSVAGFGGWALLQALLTMLAIRLFLRNHLSSGAASVAAAAVFLLPVVFAYSVFHAHDSFAGALLLLALALSLRGGDRPEGLAVPAMLATAAFRVPAAVAFLPLAIPALAARAWPKALSVAALSALCVVVATKQNLLVANVPFGQTGISYLWDEIHVASRDPDGSCGLPLLPPGDPDLALAVARAIPLVDAHGMYSVGRASLPMYDWARSDEGNAMSAAGLAAMWRACPVVAASAKLEKAASAMGVSRPLEDAEIFRSDHLETMERRFGYRDTPVSRAVIAAYKGSMAFVDLPRRPWVVLAVAALVAAAHARRTGDRRLLLAAACAAMAYAPYLAVSQNHEFRYFYPSFLVCLAVTAAGLWSMATARPSAASGSVTSTK